MAVAPLVIQTRYRELGRLRMGEKGSKGQPVKRSTWRLTSADKSLLDGAAELWGGEVTEWEGAPTEGTQWELATDAAEIPVLVPQQDLEGSQYLEAWSGGGVQRRCDGVTELISGRACRCDPDARECKLTTHLLLMLPQLPDVGVWRLTTHGVNAAAELPGTVALLNAIRLQGGMPGAKLAIESRTSKSEGQTRHFTVPVLRLPQSLLDLGAASETGGIPQLTGGTLQPVAPPSLPGGRAALPADASFQNGREPEPPSDLPAPPPLPGEADVPASSESTEPVEVDRRCPACGSEVWDNRQKIADGEFSEKSPKFSCKNKDACVGVNPDGEIVTDGDEGKPWVTWHAHYFDASDLTPAEMATVDEISAHVETGAVSASTVVAIARRVAKKFGEDGLTSVEALAGLSSQALARVAEEVAIKVADSMGVA